MRRDDKSSPDWLEALGLKDVLEFLNGDRTELERAWEDRLKSVDLKGLGIKAFRTLERGAIRLFGTDAISVADVRMLSVPDGPRSIPVRLYRGHGAAKGAPLIIYFHGGGFISGSIDSHDGITRHLANAARGLVLSVEYRLAPEHPYPAALEDALAVALRARRRAAAYDCDPARLYLAGDSAGGTIATVLARLLAEEEKAFAGQVLFYPATDLSRERLFTENTGNLGALERRGINLFRQLVLGRDGDLTDPTISPLFAPSLDRLPPTYMVAAGRDPLKAEVDDYKTALETAGVPVTYRSYAGQPHGFIGFGRIMKDAGPALQAAGKWIRQGEKAHG